VANKNPHIKYAGYFFAPTGYGAAARAYLHALHKASVELTLRNQSKHSMRHVPDNLAISLLDRALDCDFSLLHTEPNEIVGVQLPPNTVMMTTWETDTLPAKYIAPLNSAREVWVPCTYNVEHFSRQLNVPVVQIPHPVPVCYTTETFQPQINAGLNLSPDDFVFVSTATWQERKNLQSVIEAFLRAFAHEKRAYLVIKTRFAFVDEKAASAQISEAISRAGTGLDEAVARIRICAANWSEDLMTALAHRANCYVSLHRGEGWCYPLFEAACNGIPVIATAYSGPMDFLDRSFHNLVDFQLVSPKAQWTAGWNPFTSDMLWADPDVEQAAQLMRSVYDNYQAEKKRALAGAVVLQTRFAAQTVGQIMSDRFKMLIG